MYSLKLADLPTSNEAGVVLAHCPASTGGLAISVMAIPADAERRNYEQPTPRILVAHQGRGRRWYTLGGRTRSLHTAPAMIEMYEQGLCFDHCSWQGEHGHSVLVEFADPDVEAITHGELRTLPIRTRHEVFDDRVSRLTLALADEMMDGAPNRRLYVQGLSIALIGVIADHYAKDGERLSANANARLGPAQQRRVTQLIHTELAGDLSLTRLAEAAGLSPYHFTRVFKATFGTTPHRYVQDRRLDAAARALKQLPSCPIAVIALEHGFASQSHMTHLMRRRLGATPRELRRSA